MEESWINIEGDLITLKDTPDLLRDLNLIPIFLRRYFENKYTCEIIPNREEQINFQKQFMHKENITDKETLDKWLKNQGISEADINRQLFKSLRLEMFKHKQFDAHVEPLFLKRKSGLDRVTYSLIRVKNRAKAVELQMRLNEEESTFPELASNYSEGVEQVLHGLIGPIELDNVNPLIAERLKNSSPGKLWPPFQVEEWWVLLRNERFLPATLNQNMRLRLINELYENWIRKKILDVISQLKESAQAIENETKPFFFL